MLLLVVICLEFSIVEQSGEKENQELILFTLFKVITRKENMTIILHYDAVIHVMSDMI